MGKKDTDPITMVDDGTEAAEAAAKAEADAAEAAAKAKANRPRHVIADGHALTEGTRVLGPGDAVSAAILSGGDKAFKKFLKDGHIRVND